MAPTTITPPAPIDIDRADLSVRFRDVAAAMPMAPAVVDQAREWTYDRLQIRAGQIAGRITGAIIQSRQVVAVLMPTDALHIAAVLGVLESDNIYVSLDPGYPEARLSDMIRISGAVLVCATAAHGGLARTLGVPVIELDDQAGDPTSGYTSRSAPRSPLAIACLYFTSGSTGAPKAVAHTHRNILFDIRRQTRDMQITPGDRFDLLFSASFSAFLSPVFGALLVGASVHPFSLKAHSAEQLRNWLEQRCITISTMSVSGFRHLAGVLPAQRGFPCLRALSVGAEPLALRDLATFRRHFRPDAFLQNALATTETRTIAQICYPGTGEMPAEMSVGHAVEGKDLRLIDSQGNDTAPGEDGEIVIESEFISPGRWEDLRTLASLRLPVPRRVVHRTGDVGRRLADGRLLHLGRNDDQIKIRGHRVSLGDIESALLTHASVKTAAAFLSGSTENGTALAALVIPQHEAARDATALEAHLRTRLPDYMIPARIAFVDALPLTPSGKVARRELAGVLPALELPAVAAVGDSPTDLESAVLTIWRRHLRRPELTLDNDFFAFGGDSLLAAEITVDLERTCASRVPVGSFLEARTARRFAQRAARHLGETTPLAFVAIHPGAGGSPIYLVPPWNSSCLLFRELQNCDGGAHPIIALEGADSRVAGPAVDSIETIASLYADTLALRHPDGAFSIGGYSMGGFVAWETCRLLRRRGIRVQRMILLDCPRLYSRVSEADLAWMRRTRSLPGRVRSLAGRIIGIRDANRRRFLSSTTLSLSEKLAWLLWHRWQPRDGAPALWEPDYARNVALSKAHAIESYDGPVLLIRATLQSDWINRILPDLGWKGWCDGGLQIEDVPGDHLSIFRAPHVHTLHAALQKKSRAA